MVEKVKGSDGYYYYCDNTGMHKTDERCNDKDNEELQSSLCGCDLPHNKDGNLSGALEAYPDYNQNCASSSGIASCPIQMYDNYNNDILFGGTTPYTSGGYGTDYASMIGGTYGTGYCNNAYGAVTDEQLCHMPDGPEKDRLLAKRNQAWLDEDTAYYLDDVDTVGKAEKIIEKMEKSSLSLSGLTGKDVDTIKKVYNNADPAEQEALKVLYRDKTGRDLANDLEQKDKDRKATMLGVGCAGVGAVATGFYAGAAIGSIIPVGGTIIGGLIGAGVGYLAGKTLGNAVYSSSAELEETETETETSEKTTSVVTAESSTPASSTVVTEEATTSGSEQTSSTTSTSESTHTYKEAIQIYNTNPEKLTDADIEVIKKTNPRLAQVIKLHMSK